MSTQEIGQLVESVNQLTATVAGKMGQIDQKVDEATASVPGTIKAISFGTYYVDCVNGDDNNSGTSFENAFKTIWAAASKLIPGGDYIIQLSPGEHYVDNLKLNGQVLFHSRTNSSQYRVSQAVANGESLDLAVYTKITLRKSQNKRAQIFGEGSIRFYNCLISHDLAEGQYAGSGESVGHVNAAVLQAPSVQFSISGYESDDYDVPLTSVSGYGGDVLTSVGWETLAVKGKVNKVIGGNKTAKGLLAYANNTLIIRSVKSDGVTASDLFVSSDFRGVLGS